MTSEVLQKAHSIFKANVYLEHGGDKKTVVKDYSGSPALIRDSLCRFLLNREIRTLQKLSGIRGIPELHERIGKYAYRMQYCQGTAPTTRQLGTTPELLEQLIALVEEMHKAGVTHNDLRPDNLILSESNQLFLIDFGAAFYRPGSSAFIYAPARWLYSFLTGTDRSKIARIKQEFRPEELSVEELKLINRTRFARKTTRWWKDFVLPVISPGKHRPGKHQK